jgi:hypothetical protein
MAKVDKSRYCWNKTVFLEQTDNRKLESPKLTCVTPPLLLSLHMRLEVPGLAHGSSLSSGAMREDQLPRVGSPLAGLAALTLLTKYKQHSVCDMYRSKAELHRTERTEQNADDEDDADQH